MHARRWVSCLEGCRAAAKRSPDGCWIACQNVGLKREKAGGPGRGNTLIRCNGRKGTKQDSLSGFVQLMITADVFYLITAEKQRLSEGDATARQRAQGAKCYISKLTCWLYPQLRVNGLSLWHSLIKLSNAKVPQGSCQDRVMEETGPPVNKRSFLLPYATRIYHILMHILSLAVIKMLSVGDKHGKMEVWKA